MMLTKWYSCGFNHIIINLHVQMSPSCLGYLYNQIIKTIVYSVAMMPIHGLSPEAKPMGIVAAGGKINFPLS